MQEVSAGGDVHIANRDMTVININREPGDEVTLANPLRTRLRLQLADGILNVSNYDDDDDAA